MRGAETEQDYAILTNEIMQGAFDLKVDDYKKHKALTDLFFTNTCCSQYLDLCFLNFLIISCTKVNKRQNLRDHMTDLELIITMLGEAATTRITQDRDSQGVPQLQADAKDGGAVAGRTRKDIERQTGTKVISQQNFLPKQIRKEIQ